jgi:hypothetical protein
MAKRLQLTWFDQIRLRAKQEDLLTVLRTRFSPVPEELARRIEEIESPTDLDTILARASTATSLEEVRSVLPH